MLIIYLLEQDTVGSRSQLECGVQRMAKQDIIDKTRDQYTREIVDLK